MIAAATVFAYWPSLSVPFHFDDYARITGNLPLRSGNWLRGIGQLGGSRVLPSSTIAFNFWLSGENTFSYHLINLLVHLAACGAVFVLATRIAATPRLSGTPVARSPLLFAAAAAAFFACHPLQTQAVTYIIQRSASMAALFYVLGVSAYLSGRLAQSGGKPGSSGTSGGWSFAAALGFAAAALLSKENAVTLPLAVLLAEVAFFGRAHLGRALRLGVMAAPVLALPVVFKLVAWRVRRGVVDGGSAVDGFLAAIFSQGLHTPGALGPLDYFLTQMVVIPRYLALALAPVGQNVDHDIRLATGFDPGVAAGALLLLGLVAVGLWALRSYPVLGFGILWVLVTLSVESSFIPIFDVMMEHRMYLAMPGVAVLFAGGVSWVAARNKRAALVSTVVVVAVLSVLTFQRNRVWQSALSLWTDSVSKSPNKARVHINVGVAHHALDHLEPAIFHYCRAIEIDPEISVARDNIEIAVEQQGRLDDVMAQIEPKQVETQVAMPGAPKGAIVLEYDISTVVCE